MAIKRKTTKVTAIRNNNKKILDFKIGHMHDSKTIIPIMNSIK
jgi:hypothetical protein